MNFNPAARRRERFRSRIDSRAVVALISHAAAVI
jgi:hypothetical protein